jgi:subtilisin family serine protease
VVVASGNTSRETEDYGFAGLDNVIVVGATDLDDKRAKFSNWGKNIKIAAPGIEVLSLRARRTDFLLVSKAKDYKPLGAAVGEGAAYYRASGTSFAAPLVSGVASLILSANPKLSAEQVTRMILNSARDIETPGFDQFTGNGLLDARAALAADPEFFVTARIANARAAKTDSGIMLEVSGTVAADKLKRAWIEAGAGPSPKTWAKVSDDVTAAVTDNTIALVAPSHFKGQKEWTLRLIVEHANGSKRESRFNLKLG